MFNSEFLESIIDGAISFQLNKITKIEKFISEINNFFNYNYKPIKIQLNDKEKHLFNIILGAIKMQQKRIKTIIHIENEIKNKIQFQYAIGNIWKQECIKGKACQEILWNMEDHYLKIFIEMKETRKKLSFYIELINSVYIFIKTDFISRKWKIFIGKHQINKIRNNIDWIFEYLENFDSLPDEEIKILKIKTFNQFIIIDQKIWEYELLFDNLSDS